MNSMNVDGSKRGTGVWIVISIDTTCNGNQRVKTQISFDENKAIEIFESESYCKLRYVRDMLCKKYNISENVTFKDIREEVLKNGGCLEMGYVNDYEKLLTIHNKFKNDECCVNDIFVKMYFIDESENDKTFNKVLLKNIDSVDSFFSGKVVK